MPMQEMTDVNGEIPLVIKFTLTQCNFTRGPFYVSEQIYIYVQICV